MKKILLQKLKYIKVQKSLYIIQNRYNNMKVLAILVLLTFSFFTVSNGFLERQLNYPRVKIAYAKKESLIRYMLSEKQIDKNYFDVYFRAFKEEQSFEIWAKNSYQETYRLIKTIPFCTLSGTVGPKRKQGDRQIPEGFYKIAVFNPQSDYYLSLGINYPNKSDSVLGERGNLGGDIYIHGGCESIGCIPLTDDKIEDVYLLAAMAKNGGQTEIPIHIFPNRMNMANYKYLIDNNDNNTLRRFWGNIRTGYLMFEQNGTLPIVSINNLGFYEFKK